MPGSNLLSQSKECFNRKNIFGDSGNVSFCREVGKTKRKNDLEIKTYRLNVLPAIFKLRHHRDSCSVLLQSFNNYITGPVFIAGITKGFFQRFGVIDGRIKIVKVPCGCFTIFFTQ